MSGVLLRGKHIQVEDFEKLFNLVDRIVDKSTGDGLDAVQLPLVLAELNVLRLIEDKAECGWLHYNNSPKNIESVPSRYLGQEVCR